jgi:hypothetical protein
MLLYLTAFNILVNVGVVLTYPILISIGTVLSVPGNAGNWYNDVCISGYQNKSPVPICFML